MITIYKIYCKDENIKDAYIGSTKDFENRRKKHIYNCTDKKNGKYHYNVYEFIRTHGGFQNWDFEELEKCNECNRFHKERYYIENLEQSLNKNIPTRSHKEYAQYYYLNNKERENNRCRKYYQEITKIRKSKKITCYCGSTIQVGSLQYHLQSKKHVSNLAKKQSQ